jgi:hypothetical protein
MALFRTLLPVVLLVAGCATTGSPKGPASASEASLPTGARLSAEGYLTIREAPPSPFPATPPPEPRVVNDFARRTSSPDPAVRARAWEEANGSAEFQAELQRLRQVMAREEAETFVDVRLVRDPAVAAEVWFTQDAARTLARHTSDPRFRARQGGLNARDQARLRALWAERTEGGDLISHVGVNPFTGEVEVGSAVEAGEFRRRAAERGWVLGPEVKLSFPAPAPRTFAASGLETRIRAFSRETRAKGIQLTGGYSGRIVLEDGCFRLAGDEGRPGPLVVFGRQTQLGLDAQSFLVVLGEEGRKRYRVGEIASWPGPNPVDENDRSLRELRRRCGGGPVVNVAEPESQRLFSAPYPDWVADYARARSLSYEQAWREVINCMEREERRGREGLESRDRCIRQFN